VYTRPSIHAPFLAKAPPPLYLTHPIPHRPLTSVQFAPFQDVLTIGHSAGLSSILVPGSGEANFDSAEADPFENKRARREKEVKALLDKVGIRVVIICFQGISSAYSFLSFANEQIQPDMITLDPEFVGSLAPPSKLTTETTFDGRPSVDIPYARLPRLERLKVSGKIDEAEDLEADAEEGDEAVPKKLSQEEVEKKKMRGRSKSLKRYVLS
jgi:U3 small nucleolar RNA-associated protein 7